MIENIHPKDNPVAIAVKFDTIINGVSLNPGESYTVTGPTFIGGAGGTAIQEGLNIIFNRATNSNISMIPLEASHALFYSIYYPSPGDENVLYLVPTKRNAAYEGGYQELTEASQLDSQFSSSVPYSWRQAAIRWVALMADFVGAGTAGFSGDVIKRLGFSVIGNDTNLAENTRNFEIALKFYTGN